MLLSVAGSAIVSVAWIVVHGHRMASYWQFDLLVGVHLSVLLMGFYRRQAGIKC
jgi:hypothetical protein